MNTTQLTRAEKNRLISDFCGQTRDYTGSLEAMHFAEERLPAYKRGEYLMKLPPADWNLRHAEAETLADAFLATLP